MHPPFQKSSLSKSSLSKRTFIPSTPWKPWSLGGIYLDLRYHTGGMQIYNKHSFSFQACVNMKPNSSRVLYGSSLYKNEPILDLHLVIAFYLLNSARWALVSLHRHHLFGRSYTFTWVFSFPEEPQQWVVLLASLLTFTCFEQFHHYRNQLLPFIPLVPLGRVAFKLFSDSKNMKRLPSVPPFDSLKRIKWKVFFQLFSDHLKRKRLPSYSSWLVKR